jgi:hypothetical protein
MANDTKDFEETRIEKGGFRALANALPGTFKYSDIEEYGDDGVVFTVRDFGTVLFPNDKDPTACLWFEGINKKLALSGYRVKQLKELLLSMDVDHADDAATQALLAGGTMKLRLKMGNWPKANGGRQYGIGIVAE